MSLSCPALLRAALLLIAVWTAGLLHGSDDDEARKLFERAQTLVAGARHGEAAERCALLVKRHPGTEWASLALWELYRIRELEENPTAAFAALDLLVNGRPGHFAKAHDAQLQLVQRLLGMGKGERRSLETQRTRIDPELLLEMLHTIIKNGPESETGIQARHILAIALEKAGEKTAALEAHEQFAEEYPDHELADDSGYQAASILYKEWRQMRGSGSHQREKAAMALSWFLARFPSSDKAVQARSCLIELRQAEFMDLRSQALYYAGRGNDKAARLCLELLVEKFPEAAADPAVMETAARVTK